MWVFYVVVLDNFIWYWMFWDVSWEKILFLVIKDLIWFKVNDYWWIIGVYFEKLFF